MAFEPEHGHTHSHKTGLPWLDVVMAISVVFISVLSLIVSIEHGQTMEKLVHENERMVAANTLPYLTVYSSGFDPQANRKRASFALKNSGVGPAVIDWFELSWRGKAYAESDDLIRACCLPARYPPGKRSGIGSSNVSGTVLPAKEIYPVFIDADITDPEVAEALERTRRELTARACYCSVLEECWVTDFQRGRPRRVKDCRVPPGMKLW